MQENTCNVCCEQYNKTRKLVKCCACEYSQCTNCVKKYLLSQIQPKCMNCNVEWKIGLLKNNLSNYFLQKDYREHTQNILYQQQKQRFPEIIQTIYVKRRIQQLQPEVKRLEDVNSNLITLLINQKEQGKKIFNQQIESMMRHEYVRIGLQEEEEIKEQVKTNYQKWLLSMNKEHEQLQQYIIECIKIFREKQKIQAELRPKQVELSIFQKEETQQQKQTLYVHCPKTECLGFIDNDTNKCKLCQTKICLKCSAVLEEKDDQKHQCKKEDLESAKNIKNNCKQCPECKAYIYRIDGCNDMFCVMCKTIFDWTTGKKTQRSTNPHYYEYIRQNDVQNTEEQTCTDGLIGIQALQNKLKKIYQNKDHTWRYITEIHRVVSHIQTWEITDLQRINQEITQQQSIQTEEYLENLIDISNYKRYLYIQNKQYQKNTDLIQIFQTYVDVSAREINEIMQTSTKKQCMQVVNETIQRINNFEKYIKEQIEQTKKNYDSKMNYDRIFVKHI